MNSVISISLEFTPNPNTLKYAVNRQLLQRGSFSFTSSADAQGKSALAEKLLSIPGICGVMIGKDFVTVTKSQEGDWDQVHQSSSATIENYIKSGGPIINDSYLSCDGHKGGASEIENRIKEILDQEIRPAVAMDGGDITFEKYENGIVYLYLQGSCSGCPSATMTLKMGIETRLKEVIPEVQEVVSV